MSVAEAFGGDNTTFAQLWYSSSATAAPVEQFYCGADSCVQGNDTSSAQITWSCSNLRCTCIPGTSFCGAPLDLTETINGLTGTLDIDCAVNGTTCNFKQATLQSLFGQNGLGLSGCTFGECVSSTVVQQFSGIGTSDSSDNGLSGGVIAGLAVVGALLLAVLGLFGLGYLSQKKARQGGRRHLDDVQPAGLQWSEISYTLPAARSLSLMGRVTGSSAKTTALEHSSSSRHLVGDGALAKEAGLVNRRSAGKEGKVIVEGISGALPYGGLMAILGPSGAGKS